MPHVRARAARFTADAVRATALVSAITVAATSGDGAVYLGLLFLVLLVPRATRLPAPGSRHPSTSSSARH
ncbi:hypothetical protein E4N62_26185 [Streptomyces sp. MNU76]|uniref:hypothetical protein n=1 Tax=Streptomyces sp. MNU76 TaxID=2560026 RepID=UPI001E53CC61|nr:hypothetical protein [Streptomyces sp. MNU76]MCC9708444.1 hypothetical protein [Streptomyces sp. MNU76]